MTTMAEYIATPAVGTSDLIAVMRSPAHYHARVAREATEATILGTAAHMAILQPELYRTTYVVAPALDRRTKAFKEWKATEVAEGQEILSQQDAWLVTGMTASVRAHRGALDLIGQGRAENTLLWNDPSTYLGCKARPDILIEHRRVLADLKTVADGNYRPFQRAIHSFGYHIQAAHALAGAETYVPGDWDTWVWIVVEKEPPFAVALYQADDLMLSAARGERRRALELIAACTKAGTFPGYPEEIQSIGLPPWAE